MHLVDLLGSVRRSSLLMCLQVGSFLSTLFIDGGCCSGVLILWGLSTTTFLLSTTKRFARLQQGRGDDSGAASARFSAYSRH